MVGFDARSTMDIDTTMTGETLSRDEVQRIIEEVVAIDLSDGISFTVTGIDDTALRAPDGAFSGVTGK